MPSVTVWLVRWIDSTFTSRATTEELLRPELGHSLLQSDFEKAVDFLPSSRRHWGAIGAITASSVVSGYAILLRKPKWSIMRTSVWTGLAGVGGSLVGEFMRIRAHRDFVYSLQDPNGFIRSLSNVMRRLRGAESMVADMEHEALEGGQSGSESTSTRTDTSPHSRWDEIRAANARNAARNSAWDALRQSHERNQVAGTDDAPSSTESDRAQEQARFDAMLEAERRGSS